VSAVVAARAAAEAVRELNHLTLALGGYVWPADVDAVIGELLTVVQRLPQALQQAGAWLEDQHATGGVGHDSSRDAVGVALAVTEVLGDLHRASYQARVLALTLEAARSASSHLTGVDPRAGAQ
jgi:hypothetical protein